MKKNVSLNETQLRNTIYKTIASMLKEEFDLSALHPNRVSNYIFHYMSRTMGNGQMHVDNPLKLKNLGFLKNVDYWDVTSGNNTSEVSNLVAWGGERGYWYNVLNNPQTPPQVKNEILAKKKDWGENTLEENKNTDTNKKVIKINESQLRNMIAKSVKKVLKEHFAPEGGYSDYEGQDMSYESIYEEAQFFLDKARKEGVNIQDATSLAEYMGYKPNSFNEADWETVHDAIEDAMAENSYS